MNLVYSSNLKFRREACGLSQKSLAALSGVSRVTINRIEKGHVDPNFSTLVKLANVLGCHVNMLHILDPTHSVY